MGVPSSLLPTKWGGDREAVEGYLTESATSERHHLDDISSSYRGNHNAWGGHT